MKHGFVSVLLILLLSAVGCSNDNEVGQEALDTIAPRMPVIDDIEEPRDVTPACVRTLYNDHLQPAMQLDSCSKANQTQISKVNIGNQKKDLFLSQCYQATNGSCWCDQLIRPNPESIDTFHCTYGEGQVHQLIHPDEDTWDWAIEAVKIVEDLAIMNINTEIIYNWWRPEPYNANVGGSATRHPFGTSVDVRFISKADQNAAFDELCKMRAQGRIRAIGYYPSTALHFGVGDNKANTWGRLCP